MNDLEWEKSHPQELEEQYRQLFEDAPVAYHELDVNGCISRVNRAECELLKYNKEDMIGRHIWDFVSEKQHCKNAFSFKILGKLPEGPFLRTYLTKTREEIVVEIYDQLLRDGKGNIIGVRSALVDVSAREAARALVSEERKWLDHVLYAIDEAILVLDQEGVIKVMNTEAEGLLDWPAERIVGASFFRRLPVIIEPLSGFPCFSLEVILKDSWEGSAILLTSHETKRRLRITSTPVKTAEGASVGAILYWARLSKTPEGRGR